MPHKQDTSFIMFQTKCDILFYSRTTCEPNPAFISFYITCILLHTYTRDRWHVHWQAAQQSAAAVEVSTCDMLSVSTSPLTSQAFVQCHCVRMWCAAQSTGAFPADLSRSAADDRSCSAWQPLGILLENVFEQKQIGLHFVPSSDSVIACTRYLDQLSASLASVPPLAAVEVGTIGGSQSASSGQRVLEAAVEVGTIGGSQIASSEEVVRLLITCICTVVYLVVLLQARIPVSAAEASRLMLHLVPTHHIRRSAPLCHRVCDAHCRVIEAAVGCSMSLDELLTDLEGATVFCLQFSENLCQCLDSMQKAHAVDP
eukprot:5965426-Amphidinium_carterae.1